MTQKFILILALSCALVSCKKDEPAEDYRLKYTGSYEATKSTKSFEDDLFAVPIENVIIEIDETSDSLVIVNDVSLTINENGKTGRVIADNQVFDLTIEGDSMRLFTHPDAVGFFVYCYIKGKKK